MELEELLFQEVQELQAEEVRLAALVHPWRAVQSLWVLS